MPIFSGRWRGRLIYHWKRSPSKFDITSEFLDSLWIKQEGKCAYCETAIDDETLVLEHMRPLSRGGRTSEDNICFACIICNERKGAMDFRDWLQIIGWDQPNPPPPAPIPPKPSVILRKKRSLLPTHNT